MPDEKKKRVEETLSPVRNFTLRLEDQMRAAGGPPAYMRRKRTIEDLEEFLLCAVRDLHEKAKVAAASAPGTNGGKRKMTVAEALREAVHLHLNDHELNRLIAIHNRYYTAEANLPVDLNGVPLERGKPWKPLEPITLDGLVDRVLRETSEPSTAGANANANANAD